jgi:hypothetical protein
MTAWWHPEGYEIAFDMVAGPNDNVDTREECSNVVIACEGTDVAVINERIFHKRPEARGMVTLHFIQAIPPLSMVVFTTGAFTKLPEHVVLVIDSAYVERKTILSTPEIRLAELPSKIVPELLPDLVTNPNIFFRLDVKVMGVSKGNNRIINLGRRFHPYPHDTLTIWTCCSVAKAP